MRTVRLLFGVVALLMAAGVLTSPIDTVTGDRSLASSGSPPAEIPLANATASPETSKMSRFLDDFTSAFKQGTAKMKESLESAATSVKDGVLQGYDYVRSKLTGGESATPPTAIATDGEEPAGNSTTVPVVAPLTSVAPSTETPAISPSKDSPDSVLAALGGMVGVSNEPAHIVPNDDDDDDSRIIFNDKDYVTEIPATTTVTVDNRFIFAGPLACKSGQEVVNGKCRNVF
uniref:Uncharacterized protein n=1 Tax=Anopheles farauti TaxID=69004 RepID=A0A182Q1J4_9DIPT